MKLTWKQLGACAAALSAAIPATAQQQTAPVPAPLPVRKVTLFTSGVAYTERGGTVDGNAAVPLLFRTAQINDILKSLVLLDQTGQVQPATYAARDPVSHTLQSFAVDVTRNSTQGEILNQLRGAKVTVETPNKPALTGQILGVEERQTAGEDGKPITASFLNLLSETGLTAVRLDGERTVRLLDERLNREFHDALATLATGADDQRRQVTLHFAGNGSREVRVGYVTEAPLWKMSYRLLLGGAAPETPGGKPYLQGWAMVENTSDDDWNNVRLSLVSGRPISFIQDLYQPLYIPRPLVGPDIVASPYPQMHDENLDSPANRPAPKPNAAAGKAPGGGSLGPQGPLGDKGDSGAVAPARRLGNLLLSPGVNNRDLDALTADNSAIFRQSVEAQAAGQKAGELFQYNITSPVNLPRQQSALIPVVAQDVEAEKVSIFNADSGSKFPLNAIRLHNTTTLHLKGGPVTLFDEGVYAGDSRTEDVPPGDTRLLSYAVDLSVEGERQNPAVNTVETSLILKRRVLTLTLRERTETVYTFKSKADKPRSVLIEHPFQADSKLVLPEKAAERTASLYRFAVTVAPGKSQTLKIVTERPLLQTYAVLDSDLRILAVYTERKDISPKLKAALQEVIQRRKRVQELQEEAAARNAEVQSISNDQDRIRKNMTALDKASALYKRYVGELDAQETRIENLRQEAVRLRSQAETADRDLRAYLDSLPVVE